MASIPDQRYEELLPYVQDLHESKLANGEWLEQKGWQILSFGSSTFAIVSILLALLAQKADVNSVFWGALAVVIVLYGLMAAAAIKVIIPADYMFTPGTFSDSQGAAQWSQRYLESSDEDFRLQLLSNYLGDGTETGTIQDNERINRRKGWWLVVALNLLAATMAGQVLLAIIAVVA